MIIPLHSLISHGHIVKGWEANMTEVVMGSVHMCMEGEHIRRRQEDSSIYPVEIAKTSYRTSVKTCETFWDFQS